MSEWILASFFFFELKAKRAALTASKSRSLSTRSASLCSSFPRLQASILRQGDPLWPAAFAAVTAWSTSSCVDKHITSTSQQDNSVHLGGEENAASNGGKKLASSLDKVLCACWCYFRNHYPAKTGLFPAVVGADTKRCTRSKRTWLVRSSSKLNYQVFYFFYFFLIQYGH